MSDNVKSVDDIERPLGPFSWLICVRKGHSWTNESVFAAECVRCGAVSRDPSVVSDSGTGGRC